MSKMDLFNIVAGLASIIGLAITAKVAWDVREIQKQYHRRARLPSHQKSLDKCRQMVSELLRDTAKNRAQLEIELSELSGRLPSLSQMLSGSALKKVQRLQAEISDVVSLAELPPDHSDRIRRVHLTLAELNSELQQVAKDDQWRGT
jgi:hypothetical protein